MIDASITIGLSPPSPRGSGRRADTLADPHFGFLAGSDLADEADVVRIVPLGLNLQELSQLWMGIFSKTDYALSVAYRASVILLTAEETPSPAPPVRERRLLVETLRQPVIDTVTAVDGPGVPIVLGTALTVGRHPEMVTSVAFSLDGNRIVSTSDYEDVRVWDATPLKK